MRKKRGFLILMLLSILALSACADREWEVPAPKIDELEMKTASYDKSAASGKIGIFIYSMEDTFMSHYCENLTKYLSWIGYGSDQQILRDAMNDSRSQFFQIKKALSEGCAGLIVNAVNPGDAPAITDLASKYGVPVVFINREPDIEEEKRWESEGLKACYVGCDVQQPGQMQGEIIWGQPDHGDLNGDGVVSYIMLQGDPLNRESELRTALSVGYLTDKGMPLQLLDTGVCNWDASQAEKFTEQAYAEYGSQIDVVFCNNDAMAIGALQAIQAAGYTVGKDVYLVGVDGLDEMLKLVKGGLVTGTALNDSATQSHSAVNELFKMIEGQDSSLHISCDSIKITESNAGDFLEGMGTARKASF